MPNESTTIEQSEVGETLIVTSGPASYNQRIFSSGTKVSSEARNLSQANLTFFCLQYPNFESISLKSHVIILAYIFQDFIDIKIRVRHIPGFEKSPGTGIFGDKYFVPGDPQGLEKMLYFSSEQGVNGQIFLCIIIKITHFHTVKTVDFNLLHTLYKSSRQFLRSLKMNPDFLLDFFKCWRTWEN